MKKQILTAVIALIPSLGFAKVADFNALISENMNAQQELHTELADSLQTSRKAVQKKNQRHRIVIVEEKGSSYNAPTRKDLLAFKKEKVQHRANDKKMQERFANELNSSESF